MTVTSTPITNKNMSKGEVNTLATSPSYRLIRVTHEMAGQGGIGTGPEKTLSAQAKLLEAHAALSSVALNNRRVSEWTGGPAWEGVDGVAPKVHDTGAQPPPSCC